MAALPNIEPFTHLRLAGGRMYVSRCAECGLVVAASPNESLLFLAERLHTCPVYLSYNGLELVP
jgi:hypothetical protein